MAMKVMFGYFSLMYSCNWLYLQYGSNVILYCSYNDVDDRTYNKLWIHTHKKIITWLTVTGEVYNVFCKFFRKKITMTWTDTIVLNVKSHFAAQSPNCIVCYVIHFATIYYRLIILQSNVTWNYTKHCSNKHTIRKNRTLARCQIPV